MASDPMTPQDMEDLLAQAARARRLAMAIPNDPMGQRLIPTRDDPDCLGFSKPGYLDSLSGNANRMNGDIGWVRRWLSDERTIPVGNCGRCRANVQKVRRFAGFWPRRW